MQLHGGIPDTEIGRAGAWCAVTTGKIVKLCPSSPENLDKKWGLVAVCKERAGKHLRRGSVGHVFNVPGEGRTWHVKIVPHCRQSLISESASVCPTTKRRSLPSTIRI